MVEKISKSTDNTKWLENSMSYEVRHIRVEINQSVSKILDNDVWEIKTAQFKPLDWDLDQIFWDSVIDIRWDLWEEFYVKLKERWFTPEEVDRYREILSKAPDKRTEKDIEDAAFMRFKYEWLSNEKVEKMKQIKKTLDRLKNEIKTSVTDQIKQMNIKEQIDKLEEEFKKYEDEARLTYRTADRYYRKNSW